MLDNIGFKCEIYSTLIVSLLIILFFGEFLLNEFIKSVRKRKSICLISILFPTVFIKKAEYVEGVIVS